MKNIEELKEIMQGWPNILYEQCVRGEWNIVRKELSSGNRLLELTHRNDGKEVIIEMSYVKLLDYWNVVSMTINGVEPNMIIRGYKLSYIWTLSQMREDYELYMGTVGEDVSVKNGEEGPYKPNHDDSSVIF